MTDTNIKNLPEGTYFTEYGYSQSYPWKVVSRTAKTCTVARVNVKVDPEWKEKMEVYPGGFCAHVANQRQQTWLFDSVDEKYTRTLRLTKRGWALKGTSYVEGRAVEFYDYNF